jgi:hypothetical protein
LLDDRLSQRPTEAPVNQPIAVTNVATIAEDAAALTITFNLAEGTFAAMKDVLLNQRNQDKGREKQLVIKWY